jgi:superfamily I DNA/RNA helicase
MRWAREVLDDLHYFGAHTQDLTASLLLKISNGISIDENVGLDYLSAYFEEFFRKLKIGFRALDKLASDYESFFSSSAARVQRLLQEGAEFISDITTFRRVFQTRSGITVSTIHGVKGAEFDAVIAYALLEGMVPHFNDAHPRESASKLLYVIGSRARKNLYLISERGRVRYRNGPQYKPTEVLDECRFDYNSV